MSTIRIARRYVLSSYGLRAPNSLLFYHCALAVLLVEACRSARLVRLEPLRWPLVKAWLPVNLLFVGMLVTSFYALQVRAYAFCSNLLCLQCSACRGKASVLFSTSGNLPAIAYVGSWCQRC